MHLLTRCSSLVTLAALITVVVLPTHDAHAGKRAKLKKLDVASLTVQAADGSVCAGQEEELVVVATLADGSVLRSPDELRPRDFELRPDIGVVKHKDTLLVGNTGMDLLNRSVNVAVSGKRSTDAGSGLVPLDFGCALAVDYTGDGQPGEPWVAPIYERQVEDYEEHVAETGKTGPRLKDIANALVPVTAVAATVQNARPALKGEPGSDGTDGDWGVSGGAGGTGGPGLEGRDGHDLVVEVGAVQSEAGDWLALVGITRVDGTEPTRTMLIDPAAGGSLELVTRGGLGGDGGNGGSGGDGGDGGAHGGPGGAGGPGAAGGDGGDVQIRYDAQHPWLAGVVQVDAAGGAGGAGGNGGSGGWGGDGVEGGTSGDNGAEGPHGQGGPQGAPGTVTTTAVPGHTLFANTDGVGSVD